MREIIPFAIIISIVSFFTWTTDCFASTSYFQTGFHFDWWQNDEDNSGMQFYIPIEAGTEFKDLAFDVSGACVYTQVDPSGERKESLHKFTDTKLNVSYEILNQTTFDMLFGLGFNLPTGYTDLKQEDLALIISPDLISITPFGEGLNVNPTVVISKEWEYLVAGIGFGYTWRGEYDYSFDLQDYDPGDIYSIITEFEYYFSTNWSGKIFGEYLYYEKDKVNGDDFYQEGDVLLTGLGAIYSRYTWNLEVIIQGIFRGKSKFQDGIRLPAEERKSHGDEWILGLDHRYFLNDDTTVNTGFQFLWLNENQYPSTSPYYIGTRKKISLFLGMEKSLRNNVDASLGARGFYMDDEMNWYHPLEDQIFSGYSLGGNLIIQF